jgi:Sec7-like guanine-nucleotide exchange factor
MKANIFCGADQTNTLDLSILPKVDDEVRVKDSKGFEEDCLVSFVKWDLSSDEPSVSIFCTKQK